MSQMQSSTNEGSIPCGYKKHAKYTVNKVLLSYEHDLCSVWGNVLCHGNDAPETG